MKEIIQLLRVENLAGEHPASVVSISPAGLIFAQFKLQNDKLLLSDFIYEPLSPKVFDNQLIKDTETIKGLLEGCSDMVPGGFSSVISALPFYQVRTKKIKLDAALNDFDRYRRAKDAARKLFPDMGRESYIDYYTDGVIEKIITSDDAVGSDKNHREITANIVVCSSEIIDNYTKLFSDQRLNLTILDVDIYATGRAVNLFKLPDENAPVGMPITAVIEFDYAKLSLMVFKPDALIYQNVESYEGEFWDEFGEISGHCDDYTLLFGRIDRLLQFYYTKHQLDRITTFYIAGLGALLPSVLDQFKQKFGDSVKIADPVRHIEISELLDHELIQEKSPLLLPVIGMGMRARTND